MSTAGKVQEWGLAERIATITERRGAKPGRADEGRFEAVEFFGEEKRIRHGQPVLANNR
jgi:hypothetical protein